MGGGVDGSEKGRKGWGGNVTFLRYRPVRNKDVTVSNKVKAKKITIITAMLQIQTSPTDSNVTLVP